MTHFVDQLNKLEEEQELNFLKKDLNEQLEYCINDESFTSTPRWISHRRYDLIKLIVLVEKQLDILKL
ncbi:MAG: hypothetical protein ACC656_02145 [Candidatus Heimdallarchaeota archaeon]